MTNGAGSSGFTGSGAVATAQHILNGRQVSIDELLPVVTELRSAGERGLAGAVLDRVGERILAGHEVTAGDVLRLVKNGLKAERRFGLARKLLNRYASRPAVKEDREQRLAFGHQRSLCTYKDPDLPADERLEQALAILREVDDLKATVNQETLGQAGAIHKRKWELTAQERFLETSFAYYIRGYREGIAKDYGYTAINAAFVADLLASYEEAAAREAGLPSDSSAARRKLARQIRTEIVAILPGLATNDPALRKEWWFLVTLGEAHFGLAQYQEAGQWLRAAAGLPGTPDWEWEATARQLAALLPVAARTLGEAGEAGDSAAIAVLREFLGNNFDAVTSIVRGKVGVALSGGGFRASLFHIGVLARLAELDLLRHIEYLSCVSGGSIIGAHYYLEVRKLLAAKCDHDIQARDYVEIVERIQRDFLAGVQRNIRTRILAEWWTNVKTIVAGNYSRTMRAGDLYESELYDRVQDGAGQEPRWIGDLRVRPKDDPDLMPKDHNWRRSNKVPILVLNATSLNTGHNWQFTASWMGEPPDPLSGGGIDANYRLRRMYYSQLPEDCRSVRLGHAVAASACVPGIFEPLPLDRIYPPRTGSAGAKPEDITVELVDGGVHDNQGVASLLEQGCTVLLVSDASGQMDIANQPSTAILGVSLRANSILQARVREAQFRELDARRRAGLLRGLMFIHLKQGLEGEPVDWVGCQDPSEPLLQTPLLPYGIHRTVQRRLAAIRTDLDSFSEAEAYALMTSGYRMTDRALQGPALGFTVRPAPYTAWSFLKVEPLMCEGGDTPLLRQLAVSDQLFLRVWRLSRPLKIAGIAALVVLAALAGIAAYRFWATPLLTVGSAIGMLAGVALGAAGLKALLWAVQPTKALEQVLTGLGMATGGWLVARLHLHVFDPWFLRQGQVDRLLARRK